SRNPASPTGARGRRSMPCWAGAARRKGAFARRAIAGPSAAERFRAVHDARGEEDDELGAGVAGPAALEEQAEDGDVAEDRHGVEVAAGVAREDAADDGGVAVHDEQVGLGLALQDGGIAAGGGLVEVRLVAVDLDVHGDAAVARHVRLDEELELRLL